MQECPSCLESFSSDASIVPHCGEPTHGACQDCTTRWYKQESHEPCMICRATNKQSRVWLFCHYFVYGVVVPLYFGWFMYTNEILCEICLSFIILKYFYTYHKFSNSLPTRNTWICFTFGVIFSTLCIIMSLFWFSHEIRLLLSFIVYYSVLFGVLVHISCFLPKLLFTPYTLFLQVSIVIAGLIPYIYHLIIAYTFYCQLQQNAGVP